MKSKYRNVEQFYSTIARFYNAILNHHLFTFFERQIKSPLPFLKGRNILEIGVGTGFLLTQYPSHVKAVGIDISKKMLQIARSNLLMYGKNRWLIRANGETLPFKESLFDTVVLTFVVSSIFNIKQLFEECRRILTKNGRIIIVDVGFPQDNNFFGKLLAKFWEKVGDIIRDEVPYLENAGFKTTYKKDFSMLGTVHIIIGDKR